MPKENKSDNATFQERVFIVMEMLLSGLKRRQIIQNVSNNEELKLNWNVSDRQIDDYIAAANREIDKIFEADKDKLKKRVFAKYDFVYQKLINVKDYKGALVALEKLTALTGVAEPAKTDITTGGEKITGFNIEIVTNDE
jgi:hypothetical protein